VNLPVAQDQFTSESSGSRQAPGIVQLLAPEQFRIGKSARLSESSLTADF